MENFFKTINKKKIDLPDETFILLNSCKSFKTFDSSDELADASTGGKKNNQFEVKYDIPGQDKPYVEAVVNRVTNGIAVNYTESYMRRRDPKTMVVADSLPSDKKTFEKTYG